MRTQPSEGWRCSYLCRRPHLKKLAHANLRRQRREEEQARESRMWENGRAEGNGGGWLEVLCERRIRLRRLEVEDDIIW